MLVNSGFDGCFCCYEKLDNCAFDDYEIVFECAVDFVSLNDRRVLDLDKRDKIVEEIDQRLIESFKIKLAKSCGCFYLVEW